MKLQKQDIGVWVKAGDELPANSDLVHIRYGTILQFSNTAFYEQGVWFSPDISPLRIHNNIEWLKAIKDVYVMDENKLEAIKKGSYNDGWRECLKKYDPKQKQNQQI